jgi:hypothetical protein
MIPPIGPGRKPRRSGIDLSGGPIILACARRLKGKDAVKYSANLRVTFEMEPGQPDNLAETVLKREVGQFQQAIERGMGVGKTGVKRGSAQVEILSHGEVKP